MDSPSALPKKSPIAPFFGYFCMVATLLMTASGTFVTASVSHDYRIIAEPVPAYLHWIGWTFVGLGFALGFCSLLLCDRAFGPWPIMSDPYNPVPVDAVTRYRRPDSLSRSGVALRHRQEGEKEIWEFGGTPPGYSLMIPLALATAFGAAWGVLMLLLCALCILFGEMPPHSSGWYYSFDGIALSSGFLFFATWFVLLPFNLAPIFASTRIYCGRDQLEWYRKGLLFKSTVSVRLAEIQTIQPQGGAVIIADGIKGIHISTPFTLNENEDLAHSLAESIANAQREMGKLSPQ